MPEVLWLKGFQDFYPSLEPSRHLSHIPPVVTPIAKNMLLSLVGEGDGRDMGGIRNISPVLEPLCRKAFQEI